MIRQSRQSTLLLLIHSQKLFLTKKKLRLKIDRAAASGGQGKLTYFMHFFGVRLRQDCRFQLSFS